MSAKVEVDEVVDEIDVYINQSLAGELYVLQYPLRSLWNPYPVDGKAQFKVGGVVVVKVSLCSRG